MGDSFTDPDGAVPHFCLGERWADRVAILEVRGDVDLLTTPSLTERLDSLLAKSPHALIVDLSDTTFLASAGINALLLARQRASGTVRFAVVADGAATSRPIILLGLDADLSIHPKLDDALSAVG